MKFRHIIESFSLVLLGVFLCSVVKAQDLEEVLPIKVDVSEIDYSNDTEPSFIENLPEELPNESAIDSLQQEAIQKQEAYNNEVDKKEAQLGLILRSAYYQKITSPRWAKILSTESWRSSFLKWRYYAQIEDYVRASSEEVVRKKKNTPVEKIDIVAVPIESDPIEIETSKNDSSIRETGNIAMAKPLIKNSKETTEEETFDSDTVVLEEVGFEFSMTDLTLPDSIISEKELYPSLALSEEEEKIVDANPIASEVKEEPIQEVETLVQVPKEVEKPLESEPKKEKPAPAKSDVVTTATNRTIVEESIVKDPAPETQSKAPTSTPTVNYTDRRSMTEQFANMYGKLPNAVSGGSITDRFGYRRNAEARGLKNENYGIDISAPSSSAVTAVFPGTVLMAISQAPYDYIVTVKHGDFTTAYYFLDKVVVKVGDKVKTGQRLGKLRQSTEMAPFHFEIWQDQERVNPEPWLAH